MKTKIVIVHGMFMDSSSLRSIEAVLSDEYRVHMVELPGRAGSDISLRSVEYRSCLNAVSAAIGNEQTYLIGYSLGGLLSLICAATPQISRYIKGVSGICTTCPKGIKMSFWVRLDLWLHYRQYLNRGEPLTLRSEHVIKYMMNAKQKLSFGESTDIQEIMKHIKPESGRLVKEVEKGLPLDVNQIKCPVQLIAATNDRLQTQRMQHQLADKLIDANVPVELSYILGDHLCIFDRGDMIVEKLLFHIERACGQFANR